MKLSTKIILIVLFLLLIGGASYKILSSKPSADARRASAALVRTDQPSRRTITYRLQFNGDVLPAQQASIFSKVSGNLERNTVDMGARVREGQVLAIIDSTELYQTYQQAAATYYNVRFTYKRNKELFERNLIAKQDLDNSEAALKVAQAAFESAVTRLSYSKIKAPFAGFVTRRFLDPGALITPATSTLFMLMQLDSVRVIVNVLEKDVPVIPQIKSAILTIDALGGKEFEGRVTRYSQAIDLATRTMSVEISVANKDLILKPGMFATVTLVVGERPNAITVPTTAVLRDNDGKFLYTVANGAAKKVRIQAGIEQGDDTEILSGLAGDETVITTGQQFVRDGGPVNIQK